VDFDRGLNFCIAQIRSALGDSADAPRFIRTLPKRGYQFIAPVEPIAAANLADDAPAIAPPPVHATATPPRGRLGTAIALVIIFAVAIGAVFSWIRRPPALPRTPVVAVALFDVDDPAPDTARFAQGLTDAVIAELTTRGDGRFGVIGNASILRTARTLRDLNAIGEALNVKYVVLGSVQRDGNRMRVFAQLIRLPEQTHLTVARLDRGVEDLLGAQSELAEAIGTKFSARVEADVAPARPSQTTPSS
jgi:TolB-like protein